MKLVPIKPIIVFVIITFGLLTVYGIQRLFVSNRKETTNNIIQSEQIPRDLNEDPYVLDLSGQGLKQVPDFVFEHKFITHLILANNNITSLPDNIGQLSKIRVLDMNNNQLSGPLSPELLKMSLVDLKANNNKITGFPVGIGNLQTLRYADLGNNQINTIPDEFTKLQDLKWISLKGNPVSQSLINHFQSQMLFTIFDL